MTGRELEEHIVTVLQTKGYWAHRIYPDESGQQPFDVIACKDGKICAYDAKVVSAGTRFPLRRLEDNQYNAFRAFRNKNMKADVGLLIMAPDNRIHYVSIEGLEDCLQSNVKSLVINYFPEWRP